MLFLLKNIIKFFKKYCYISQKKSQKISFNLDKYLSFWLLGNGMEIQLFNLLLFLVVFVLMIIEM